MNDDERMNDDDRVAIIGVTTGLFLMCVTLVLNVDMSTKEASLFLIGLLFYISGKGWLFIRHWRKSK